MKLIRNLALSALFATAAFGQGAFSVTWDFDGGTEVDLSSTQLLDLSTYAVTPDAAIVSSAWSSSVMGSDWAPSFDTYNPGDYFEFTITSAAGSILSIDSVSFKQTSAGSGAATNWELRSDVDGYSTVWATDVTTDVSGGYLESETALGMAAAGNSITIRIVGVGGGPDQFAGLAVANVSVTGMAVPEPATFSLIVALGMVGMVGRRRR